MKIVLRVFGSLWFVGAASIVSIVATGLIAIHEGETYAICLLMAWGIIGMTGAIFSGQGWGRALDRNLATLRGWEEQEQLTLDLTHLLGESLDHLSTWDRETSDDIAERTRTVIRLRFQNFNERNHP